MLGDVSGLRVLDAFAGSGALGLEALSRGAAHAVFCETSTGALRALHTNVTRLDAADRSRIARRDGVRQMSADAAAAAAYDLILLDPPYTMLPALQEAFSLHLPALLVPGGIAVVEGPAGAPALALPLQPVGDRVHGETRISLHRHG